MKICVCIYIYIYWHDKDSSDLNLFSYLFSVQPNVLADVVHTVHKNKIMILTLTMWNSLDEIRQLQRKINLNIDSITQHSFFEQFEVKRKKGVRRAAD